MCSIPTTTLGALPITQHTAPPLQRTIVVGEYGIAEDLRDLLHSRLSPDLVAIDPEALVERNLVIFGRDARVIGLNYQHLIPYSILDPLLEGRYNALLPSSAKALVKAPHIGYGKGFCKKAVTAALIYAKQYHLPYKQMRSTIEGGNCFVFFDAEQKPKAIVGITSVILTAIGLEEQDYFTAYAETLKSTQETIGEPSADAVRAMRNQSIYERGKRDWDERYHALQQNTLLSWSQSQTLRTELINELVTKWGGHEGYRNLLFAPTTPAERERFFTQACEWDAKCRLAERVIAEDLGVPLSNLAILEQSAFHIDMFACVAPTGTHVYVDEAMHTPTLISTLAKIGCMSIPVPGVFHEASTKTNFMNGCFVPTPRGHLFVTQDVSRKFEDRLVTFQKAFDYSLPGVESYFLSNALETILNQTLGSLHCLTWEKLTYKTPIDIISSYVADEPIPETILRGKLLETTPLT